MSEQKGIKNKNLINAFILLSIIAVIFYFLTKKFNTSSSVILSFVGLGVVIFIHELGHFAAGKFCGIRVEAFAIGFGPIVLGVKKIENYLQIRIFPTILEKENDPEQAGLLCLKVPMSGKAGETEYQIRIFPVGGFVKLVGQEDLGSDKPSDDPRSFVNVPIWKRIVTVSAGVTLNVVLAGLIFIFVFMRGINLPPAIVGDVLPGYPAAKAGLEAGDEIIAINGRNHDVDFSSVAFAAALSGRDKPVYLKVKKTDGTIEDVNLIAMQIPGMGMKGFGIEQPGTLEVAKIDDAKKLDEQFGLKTGDVLAAVNGEKIEHAWQFNEKLQNIFEPNITLSYSRKGQDELIETNLELQYTSAIEYVDGGEFIPTHIFGLIPRLKVSSIQISEINDVLQTGDVIAQAGDKINPTYKELRDLTTASVEQELSMVVLRNGEPVDVKVTPKKGTDGRAVIGIGVAIDVESTVAAATTDTNNYPWPSDIAGSEIVSISGTEVENYFDIAKVLKENQGKTVKVKYKGLLDVEEISFDVPVNENAVAVQAQISGIPPFKILRKLYKASGPADAIKIGSRKTLEFVGQTYMTLKGLIVRDISPKSLMGPVGMIAASTKIISDRDFMQYCYFMGMISACLAVMNFLPLPIFDGGLVVLLIIEKLKGSPVHQKIQEGLVYIGLVLIIGLVLLVTYNDILRWVFGK
ncbi:MAG: hypothetical protein A2Y10_16870 [Planctomycetes bacterium GWF2_41_51]|nr:MAG: hypothetical protein A2Y10_16870 [Planctomycetes bacterium GWF2_41_51]HBG28859.1 hypothetical protein [Phycisphaerales bacterium]